MTSNDNQLLPPSNIWSNFLSGRWNSPRQMMPVMPPNLLFPYLSMNRDFKQVHSEIPGNPYSMETMQILRTMLQRQSQIPSMPQNMFPRNSFVPPFLNPQKSNDNFFTCSPGSSHLPSPVDHKIQSQNIDTSNNFENPDSKLSDLSNLRCPVCNLAVPDYELESHVRQEMILLTDSANRLYKESCSNSINASSPIQHNSDDYDSSTNSNWKSKLPYQTSISRYRNFEKIKINRYQRRNNQSTHSCIIDMKQPIMRMPGCKTRHNDLPDFGISSKKSKMVSDTNECIDMD